MKIFKSIAVGSLLLGLMSTAYAEDGYDRAKQFNQNIRAEQTRLWGNDSSDQNKQKVAQEQQKEEKSSNEKADN